jgi:hypothetical protein
VEQTNTPTLLLAGVYKSSEKHVVNVTSAGVMAHA